MYLIKEFLQFKFIQIQLMIATTNLANGHAELSEIDSAKAF
jgi:hypothetical protein